jgi:hypothetical protein
LCQHFKATWICNQIPHKSNAKKIFFQEGATTSHIDLHVAMESIGEWILVEKCVYCGLGFAPIWATRFSSYKHVYHDCCSTYHFGRTTKCIVKECEAKMHEILWGCVGLTKLGTLGKFKI